MKRQIIFPAASFICLTMLLCAPSSNAQTMKQDSPVGTTATEREIDERQKNSQIVSQLKDLGDSCLSKRPIAHYFYGSASKAQKLAEILGPGNSIEYNTATGALILTEVMACNLDDITRRTLALHKIADESGCEYDGWVSPVLRTTN
jgi:Regulator of ribonuclease activity B